MAADARADLEAFVNKNADLYPITEDFPYRSIDAIGESDDALPVLLKLLACATRYDDAVDHRGRNCYEGADLRRQAVVVGAIARSKPSSLPVPTLTSLLTGATFSKHYARPGSPDPDKYDRDSSVELAQDYLAQACAEALARHPLDDAARSALHEAQRHRSDEVARAAMRALAGR